MHRFNHRLSDTPVNLSSIFGFDCVSFSSAVTPLLRVFMSSGQWSMVTQLIVPLFSFRLITLHSRVVRNHNVIYINTLPFCYFREGFKYSPQNQI